MNRVDCLEPSLVSLSVCCNSMQNQLTSPCSQIREDVKTGVYVENLKEVEVKNVQDVVQLLIQVRFLCRDYCFS